MRSNKQIFLLSNTSMTLPASKKPTRKRTKVVETNSQTTQIQEVSVSKTPRKHVKKSVESIPQTNQSEIWEPRTISTEQVWHTINDWKHAHGVRYHIHSGLSRTGSAWQRVKKLLFSTPALAIFSLMMWASLWSDYQTEKAQLSASLQNLSEQITTQWGSGYTVSPDISLVSGIPNSDIVDFVFNKDAKDVKEIRYSLVYDEKKLQFGENLSHFEGCAIETKQVNPPLLSVKLTCNKSQDFKKDIPIISHTISHINGSKDAVINIVSIEFVTKDGSVYELAWKSKVY